MNIIRNERLEWMEEDANLFKKAWKKLVDGGKNCSCHAS
jgi:beta-mannanase